MRILILEPFFTGSHKKWACAYQQASQHDVEIITLSGHHWKWRMHGAAVQMAGDFKRLKTRPDLILASDMLDLSTFVALVRNEIKGIPLVLYFHENQITYPWSPTDQDINLQRDNHYGFINYTSSLTADYIFYNSAYHLKSFTGSLSTFLKQFPDYQGLENIETIQQKSKVLPLGIDLKTFDKYKTKSNNEKPVLLWNHRWEYDKNPEAFYNALCFLKEERLDFELILLGESYNKEPQVFSSIKKEFKNQISHFGYADGFKNYARQLWKADILPVTSNQDFFGGSVVEAIYCECYPLLPDRLAYPEHIPAALREKYFYKNDIDFHQKLKDQVLNFNSQKDNSILSNFVGQYDWSILAPKYDITFEKCVSSNNASHF